MQSNELHYHKTRAICKMVHLPDFGENSYWCYVNEGAPWIRTWSRRGHATYDGGFANCCLWDLGNVPVRGDPWLYRHRHLFDCLNFWALTTLKHFESVHASSILTSGLGRTATIAWLIIYFGHLSSRVLWFQLLPCEDLQLFTVLIHYKLNIWVSEDVTVHGAFSYSLTFSNKL